MRGSNRLILFLVPLAAAGIAFWLLAVSPKRQEASDLEAQVSDLQSQVEQQERLASGAEAARRDFPRAYRRVVVMGKAAPEDDDTSSLLVQLNRVAGDADVKFISLQNEGEEGAGAPTAAAPAPEASAEGAEGEQPVENSAPTPAPATEASAALLPIGASIGPAGLPVMKYTLSFEGDFFRLADFMAGLDDMVTTRNDGSVGVRGRLITIDSFELSPIKTLGVLKEDPDLTATVGITTFLTPAEEGATGGASPTGPAPVTEPQPASSTPTAEPTATASTEAP